MRNTKRIITGVLCILSVSFLWNTNALTSCAEEVTPPGYHEYVTTEDEVIDTWYGIARGTYLQTELVD